jgi:hypothetical protein
MSLFTIVITPGKQMAIGEALTNAKLNQIAQPTVTISNLSATPGSVNGQALVYNTSTGKWEAGTVGAAYLTTMTGCTTDAAGTQGAVPAPEAGWTNRYLAGDGTWKDLPVESNPAASRLYMNQFYI